MPVLRPKITVKSDFDGYFLNKVTDWVERKIRSGQEFKNSEIEITAGPYRSYAVAYDCRTPGLIKLDFYSALRSGFGKIDKVEIDEIIDLL